MDHEIPHEMTRLHNNIDRIKSNNESNLINESIVFILGRGER